jgi:predicted ABC-type transport system involved in lysophospholipase L1 biosynthesis ATPase subunit
MTAVPVLELRAIDRTYRTSAGELQVLRGTDLRIRQGFSSGRSPVKSCSTAPIA